MNNCQNYCLWPNCQCSEPPRYDNKPEINWWKVATFLVFAVMIIIYFLK